MINESRLRPLARAVLRTQSDARLVSLAREGREAAFEEIVRRYRPGLVAFAAAFAPADRAEDVVQESLVRSWKALEASNEDVNLKPWLYTVVRNRALNARRDAKIHAPLSDEMDGVAQPPELVLQAEELATVVSAVGALPDTQREALVRSALDGHTHEQIASALGSSPGAVRQLIYRARVTLRTSAGLLIPLPLVRMLTEHGGAGGEAAATGIAFGGAAAGAAGGASVATKVGAVAVAGLIAAGAGVAIDRSDRDGNRNDAQTVAERSSDPGGPGPARPTRDEVTPLAAKAQSPAAGRSRDHAPATTNGSGADGSSGPGSGASGDIDDVPGDDSSGPGAGGDDEPDDDSGSSGTGHDGLDPADEPETQESGDDQSGSGISGSGSGDSADDPPVLDDDPPEPEDPEPDVISRGSGSSESGHLDELLDPVGD